MHITDNLGAGGLEQVVVTICRTIDRSRFDPSVLCLSFIGALADRLADADVPVMQLPLLHPEGRRRRYLAFREVARVLRSQRIDVVHTHNTGPFIDGSLAAWRAGVRTLIHTEHGRAFPDKTRYMVAEHVLARFAYKVVGVSDQTVSDLRAFERIPPHKLARIANGIELGAFSRRVDRAAKRRELGLPESGAVVGAVARLDEAKGISYLLKAVPGLIARFPDLTVVIAGTGTLLAPLQNEARGLGVADRVRFLGLRLDVPELLQLFDVYVLPSVREGLPMGLIEAMASRCAVVATDVGGVGTLIRTDETGLLVPSRASDALSEAVARLLLDDALRDRVSETARRVAHEQYSAAAMTRQYERLYARSVEA